MNCSKCGAVNDDAAQFCDSCGASMVALPSSVGEPAAQPSNNAQARPPRRSSKHTKMIIAAVVIVAVILIATVMATAYANRSTVPDAPTGLTAISGNGTVILTWSVPISDGGAAITGYNVYENGGTTTVATVASTSTTINGLTNGMPYKFTVVAVNSIGTSTASSSVTSTPFTIPSTPTGLTITSGDDRVALSWTAPSNNGGAAISYYQVYQDGILWDNVTSTSTTFNNLTNGQEYKFTVAAGNLARIGEASSSSSATPATVSGQPIGLNAISSDGEIALRWTAPNSDGGAAITGCELPRPKGLWLLLSSKDACCPYEQ